MGGRSPIWRRLFSEAGGFGIIGAANAPADVVRNYIREAKQMTDKPFGVNIMLMSPYADEIAQVVVEEGVAAVTTGAGNPEKYMEQWKAAGIKVIPVVASVALARRYGAVRCGRSCCRRHRVRRTHRPGDDHDPGTSGGGRGGDPGDRSRGIGDGRGFAAAIMLGAEAVQMGTRFCVSNECTVHEKYKERILKAKDIDSEVTGRSHGPSGARPEKQDDP